MMLMHGFYYDSHRAINDVDALINAVPDEIAREHSIYGNIDQVREQAQKYE